MAGFQETWRTHSPVYRKRYGMWHCRRKRANIFKPFAEVKDLTKGDGLGLPICALIATRMNGSLTLDESYTKGARFILELHA